MQLCSVKLKSQVSSTHTSRFALLDTGSDKSYITTTLVKQVRPQRLGFTTVCIDSFGQSIVTPQRLPIYSVQILTANGKYITISVIEVPNICNKIKVTKIPDQVMKEFSSMNINCVYADGDQDIEVSLLIGMDNYWELVSDQILPIRRGNLVAVSSAIGYILSGTFPSTRANAMSAVSLINIQHTEDQLERFWTLDSIGILDQHGEDLNKNSIFREFIQTLEYSDTLQAYKVRLPWRSHTSRSLVGDNFGSA